MKPEARRRGVRWVLAFAAALAVGAGGWFGYAYWYEPRTAAAQEPADPDLATATVTRGDIVLIASGSGELVPASSSR